jgi:tocopherol O-methyltransferase
MVSNPMIDCATVQKHDIRSHYNLATVFYRLLWGRHIHHGLWAGDESVGVAQQRLTETLAAEARIQPGERVLDVGCGMGSSAIHLAAMLQCDVTGVTISSVQRQWARWAARWHGVSCRTSFLCADVEEIVYPARSFDVVWSIECTEHLFDKPEFFQRVGQWLRPGGRVAICAWLSSSNPDPEALRQLHDVCEGFFCPSLGAQEDYVRWLSDAGLELVHNRDWTPAVIQTWEICGDRIRRTGMKWLAQALGRNSVLFLNRFDTILEAYRTGAMKYGCFVAEKRR